VAITPVCRRLAEPASGDIAPYLAKPAGRTSKHSPIRKSGPLILSTRHPRARIRSRSASLLGSFGAAEGCGSGETSSAPRRPTQSAPILCLSLTTPAQRSGVIWRSAGPCRNAYSTYSPSSAIEPMASPLGISRNGAYAAIKAKDIPFVRIGRRILVPRAALEKKLQQAG